MASTKEKTKFLKTIDHLVDGYKDVKSKSLEYMKDYGQENLKKDLIESLLRFRQLGDDMLNFICPEGMEQEEPEVEDNEATEELEAEENLECEEESEAEEWVEGVDDEEDELINAGRVLREAFGQTAVLGIVSKESYHIGNISQEICKQADAEDTAGVIHSLSVVKGRVDNLILLCGDSE